MSNGAANSSTSPLDPTEAVIVSARFDQALDALRRYHDRFFAWLLLAQWFAAIGLALTVSPRTWAGTTPSTHAHVWAALLLGGAITLFPVWLGFRNPGQATTRHLIAVAQMLVSALLIHLTGGRIETHFHVFGSLAFLAFYRDGRVLATATVVVYLDHLLRGIFWPQSVFGVFVATPWRSLEHAFWVLFEVFFLTLSVRRGLAEMREVARRQVSLERVNERMEQTVQSRTRELSESEARFRALFQHTPIGLYRADPDGTLQLANPAMLKILGFASVDEMRARGARLQGSGHDTARANFCHTLLEHGAAEGHDTVWARADGTRVDLRESARAVADASGRTTHIDGSAEDVTDHRRLEERYLQAQKVQAMGQLAGGVAHDFNNILTAITGYADLTLFNDQLPDESRKRVLEIRKASGRAAALTQQMLAFSRKQTLQPRVLQLNSVVADLERMLHRLVGEHVHIATALAADLRAVKVDASQIQQVILNLVVNARDAMPKGGRIQIQTDNLRLDDHYARLHPGVTPGDYVVLSVTDSGCGMSPEIKARLFEPFFTTKPPGSGTGLGLATCHGIVTQSGGHISVYSEIGLGSTFKVLLPASRENVDATEPPAAVALAPRKRGGETVLLVEDENQVRALGVELLTSLGYRTIQAANGREALDRLLHPEGEAIKLVVTDLVMPEMGGRDLARKIRALSLDMPIVVTSGFAFDALQQTDLAEPDMHFLGKPYSLAQLSRTVRDALDGQTPVPQARE